MSSPSLAVVSDIVCLWSKAAHDRKSSYGGSCAIAGEVLHATISIWLGDGNALDKARAAATKVPLPLSFKVMAPYLSSMARWSLFKEKLSDEKLLKIADLLDKHVKNNIDAAQWSRRANELRDLIKSRKGKASAASAGAGAGAGAGC